MRTCQQRATWGWGAEGSQDYFSSDLGVSEVGWRLKSTLSPDTGITTTMNDVWSGRAAAENMQRHVKNNRKTPVPLILWEKNKEYTHIFMEIEEFIILKPGQGSDRLDQGQRPLGQFILEFWALARMWTKKKAATRPCANTKKANSTASKHLYRVCLLQSSLHP